VTRPSRVIDRVHGVSALGGDSQVDKKALVIPPGHWEMFDPFLMLAEDWFSTPGFDWHPHRGIETVTLVLEGALEHGDNRGNAGVLAPGDVQWMTAGSGIVHRELAHRDEHVHTLQLWVNLPSSHKMVEARYQDFTVGTDTPIPADTHWPVAGQRVTVEPGRSRAVTIPGDHRAFLYVLDGAVLAGERREPLSAGDVAWSDPVPGPDADAETVLELHAPEGERVAHAVLFSGRPIGEPVVARGPFVMNSADEIRQAFADFHAGKFGDVPALTRL
jgi:redox-sensitive bicupin YhaK (pirin superfamily)